MNISKNLVNGLLIFLIIACPGLLIGKENTSFGNYILLLLYVYSLHNENKYCLNLKSIYLKYVVQGLILLNILLLFYYPGLTQILNFPDELNRAGIPYVSQMFLINTVGSMVIVIYALNLRSPILYLLTFVFLIYASKTTSLLLLSGGLILMNFKYFGRVVLFLALVVCVYVFIELPEYIARRLEILAQMDFEADELVRIPLFYNSLETFLRNPVIGIGFVKEEFIYVSDALKFAVGHHSHFMDYLARFGIGFVFFIVKDLRRYKAGISVFVFVWMLLNNVVALPWLSLGLLNFRNEEI